MKRRGQSRLSLAPLSFDEAITDLLKIKPQVKAAQKSKPMKKTAKSKR